MQAHLIPGPQPRIEFSSRRERGFAEETGQIRNSLKKINRFKKKNSYFLSLSRQFGTNGEGKIFSIRQEKYHQPTTLCSSVSEP